MKKEEVIVMYDSPEAAQKVTLTGWVNGGITRRFWDQDEHMAKWAGCTHMLCECGNVMSKSWTKCESCRIKIAHKNYLAFPFKKYKGEPVYSDSADKYFFNEDDIIDYCNDEGLTEIELLFCVPNTFDNIQEDHWADIMPEDSDGELPEELTLAIKNLNDVIDKLPPCSYSPGKTRTTYKLSTLTGRN